MAKLLKVYFGETPLGTGPHGGHCGYCWMGDFDVCKKVILAKNGQIPTKADMKKAYAFAERTFAEVNKEKQREHDRNRERDEIARKIIAMGNDIEIEDYDE